MTDGTVYRIKLTGTTNCLTHALQMKPCSGSDQGKIWTKRGGANNFQLTRGNNMCLNDEAKLKRCDNTNNFKWKTLDSKFQSHKNGKCLQKSGLGVQMANCTEDNTKWTMEKTGSPPPSSLPAGPAATGPSGPSSSPSDSTSPSSTTTPTPSPSDGDKKFWETTWFFWTAIGGGACILVTCVIFIIIIAMSSGGGRGHHPW